MADEGKTPWKLPGRADTAVHGAVRGPPGCLSSAPLGSTYSEPAGSAPRSRPASASGPYTSLGSLRQQHRLRRQLQRLPLPLPSMGSLLLVVLVSFSCGAVFSNSRAWRFFTGWHSPVHLHLDPRLIDPSDVSLQILHTLQQLPPVPAATADGALLTSRATVLVALEGSIASRLQILCAASALLTSRGVPVTAVWVPDAGALQASFHDLFTPLGGSSLDVVDSWPAWAVSPSQLSRFAVEVPLGLSPQVAAPAGMKEGAPGTAPPGNTSHAEERTASVRLEFSIPRDLVPASYGKRGGAAERRGVGELPVPVLTEQEAMGMLRGIQAGRQPGQGARPPGTVAQCFRALRPSRPVVRRLQEQNMTSIVGKVGVFAERKRQGDDCPGCRGRIAGCAIRTIAKEYLRDFSVQVVVATEDPRDALNISKTFHVSRAPVIPVSAAARAKHFCQLMHVLATAGSVTLAGADVAVLSGEGGDIREERSGSLVPLCAQLYVADLLLLATTARLIHSHAHSPAVNLILARITMTYDDIASSLNVSLPKADLPSPAVGSSEPRMLLGAAQAIPTGTLEERHVAASKCICTSPPLHQLAEHSHAPNTIIDHELKIVYCSVEKAASTPLKMLIRSMRGLRRLDNYFSTHTIYRSGLKYLYPHYRAWAKNPWQEWAGVREMTRADYLKFVFVRNPYTRVLSAYLDKEFMGDSRNGKESAKGRATYNKKFFGDTFKALYGQQGPNGLEIPWPKRLDFHEFVELAALRAQQVPKMDHHLANQTDLCRLNDIKYHFVGHLETLQEDLDAFLGILSRHSHRNASKYRHVFPQGQRFHNLRAEERLLKFYRPDTVDLVGRLYKPDLENELNNIHYSLPPALQALVQGLRPRGVATTSVTNATEQSRQQEKLHVPASGKEADPAQARPGAESGDFPLNRSASGGERREWPSDTTHSAANAGGKMPGPGLAQAAGQRPAQPAHPNPEQLKGTTHPAAGQTPAQPATPTFNQKAGWTAIQTRGTAAGAEQGEELEGAKREGIK